MKMKSVFVKSTLLVVIFATCCFSYAQAQVTDDGTASGGSTAKPCSQVIPQLKAALQADADRTNTTKTECVECLEDASMTLVAMTVRVQPSNAATSKPVRATTRRAVTKTRGGGIAASTIVSDNLSVAYNQKRVDGGIELDVVVDGFRPDEFDYEWTLDGRPLPDMDGIPESEVFSKGKNVTVTATLKRTAVSKTISFELPSTVDGN